MGNTIDFPNGQADAPRTRVPEESVSPIVVRNKEKLMATQMTEQEASQHPTRVEGQKAGVVAYPPGSAAEL